VSRRPVADRAKSGRVTVGILALQGDFVEHKAMLQGLDVAVREVRLPEQLKGLDGLVVPGGESTTIARLLDIYALREPLTQMARRGMAVWGTCAGMILMARSLTDNSLQPLGLVDIRVTRNAFGRQVDSFEADLVVKHLGDEPFAAVFIRAPLVSEVGEGVEVLASLPDGRPVAVKQGRFLATAFHPELTSDTRFHRYFLDLVKDSG
jgi:5'-phosphate synthase pdxT subunit